MTDSTEDILARLCDRQTKEIQDLRMDLAHEEALHLEFYYEGLRNYVLRENARDIEKMHLTAARRDRDEAAKEIQDLRGKLAEAVKALQEIYGEPCAGQLEKPSHRNLAYLALLRLSPAPTQPKVCLDPELHEVRPCDCPQPGEKK